MKMPVPVTKWTCSDEKFSPFATGQLLNHCGPCSLSGCLFILGIEASQRDLATAAGKPYKIFRPDEEGGVPEEGLIRAARTFGAVAQPLNNPEKSGGRAFAARVREHLLERGPVMLITPDASHWIAVVGYLPKKAKFIIYDPIAKKNAFGLWGEKYFLHQAWYMPEDEPPEYFALLFRRRDGNPPAWTITERWMKIHDRGSDCTAATISGDLHDLVSNACGGSKRKAPLGVSSDGIPLATLLEKYRRQVLEAILYWAEGAESSDKRDLRDLYDDYMVCAEACNVRLPDNGDHVSFVAGLTALFSSYWWGAEME